MDVISEKDVTIIVNSCDIYEDAWSPFFKLLKIQWPNCQYNIVLNVENKNYESDDFRNLVSYANGDLAWSERLLKSLDNIESEFILFFLEDQFLRKPVSDEWFKNALSYMKENKDVGVIFLRHTEKQNKEFSEIFFSRFEVTDKFPITAMVGLYRKDYLSMLLSANESAWDFENKGSERSKNLPYKVLQYNNAYPEIFVYDDKIEKGYGITRRKWLPKNKELFDKYGIEVNFDNLGILNPEELIENKTTKKAKMSLIERLYDVKKALKKR